MIGFNWTSPGKFESVKLSSLVAMTFSEQSTVTRLKHVGGSLPTADLYKKY